jgi:hypothetical protein
VFTVVGLVRPPLGGWTADVYVGLAQLQVLAVRRAPSTSLVRAETALPSAGAKQIERSTPGRRSRAQQVADSISGSLVDAASSQAARDGARRSRRVAAFLLAVLLTLSSVGNAYGARR